MASAGYRRTARSIDIWPGFVDALATLIMVIVFLLMIYTLFQFHLKDLITGRDQAVSWLNEQLGQLADILAVEQRASSDLRAQLSQLAAELSMTLGQRDELATSLRSTQAERDQLTVSLSELGADRDHLSARLGETTSQLTDANARLAETTGRLVETAGSLEATRRQLAASDTSLEATRRQLAESGTSLEATRRQLAESGASLDTTRRQLTETNTSLDVARRQLADLNASLEAARRELASTTTSLEESRRQLAATSGNLEASRREATDAAARLAATGGQLADVTRQRDAALAAAQRVSKELEDANKVISADREKIEMQLRELASLRRDIEILTALRREIEEANKTISVDREKIEVQLRELAALRRDIETMTILRRELEAKLSEQSRQLQESGEALAGERKLSEDARTRIDLLTRQLNALREQIARLNTALEASEGKSQGQQVQIADLGRRLNLALASRVEELARYRSEFFGRLREALGARADIRIVGDRFVFQSEVLFPSGSAELEPEGRVQLAQLAVTLKDIAQGIPGDLNWVLQVNGHTDRRPINTPQFPSNWELSAARAISVVKFLAGQGIPADRLSAAGQGEFQPIEARDDEIALRRNRRIELKLTNR